jgi:hypothetical protein
MSSGCDEEGVSPTIGDSQPLTRSVKSTDGVRLYGVESTTVVSPYASGVDRRRRSNRASRSPQHCGCGVGPRAGSGR